MVLMLVIPTATSDTRDYSWIWYVMLPKLDQTSTVVGVFTKEFMIFLSKFVIPLVGFKPPG